MIAVSPPSQHAAAWSRRLPGLPAGEPSAVLGLAAGDPVLVVGAHPDDETIGLGGALAALAGAGVPVHLLSLTAGEAAFDHLAGLVARSDQQDRDALAARRRAELTAAAEVLGASSAEVAGFPDGGLTEYVDALAATVGEALRRTGARQVLTVWEDDPHPDHAAAGTAARLAASACAVPVGGFPVWAPHWTDPADVPDLAGWTRLLPDASAQDRRRRALAEYRSQVLPVADGYEPVVPAALLDWPHELLVRR